MTLSIGFPSFAFPLSQHKKSAPHFGALPPKMREEIIESLQFNKVTDLKKILEDARNQNPAGDLDFDKKDLSSMGDKLIDTLFFNTADAWKVFLQKLTPAMREQLLEYRQPAGSYSDTSCLHSAAFNFEDNPRQAFLLLSSSDNPRRLLGMKDRDGNTPLQAVQKVSPTHKKLISLLSLPIWQERLITKKTILKNFPSIWKQLFSECDNNDPRLKEYEADFLDYYCQKKGIVVADLLKIAAKEQSENFRQRIKKAKELFKNQPQDNPFVPSKIAEKSLSKLQKYKGPLGTFDFNPLTPTTARKRGKSIFKNLARISDFLLHKRKDEHNILNVLDYLSSIEWASKNKKGQFDKGKLYKDTEELSKALPALRGRPNRWERLSSEGKSWYTVTKDPRVVLLSLLLRNRP